MALLDCQILLDNLDFVRLSVYCQFTSVRCICRKAAGQIQRLVGLPQMLHNASHPWPAAACPTAAHHCTKADWILFKACKAHHRTCLQGAAPLCWFLICIQNLILHHNVHANLFAMSAQHRHRFLPKVAHSMCTANGTACQLVHWNCEVLQLRCHHQGLSPYLTFLHCWECQGVADAIRLMRLALQLSHWFEHFKPSASERCTSHAGVPDSDVARNMPLAHFVSTHASCLPSSFVWRDDGSIAHHVSFNGSAPKKPGASRRDYADFILLSSNWNMSLKDSNWCPKQHCEKWSGHRVTLKKLSTQVSMERHWQPCWRSLGPAWPAVQAFAETNHRMHTTDLQCTKHPGMCSSSDLSEERRFPHELQQHVANLCPLYMSWVLPQYSRDQDLIWNSQARSETTVRHPRHSQISMEQVLLWYICWFLLSYFAWSSCPKELGASALAAYKLWPLLRPKWYLPLCSALQAHWWHTMHVATCGIAGMLQLLRCCAGRSPQ